MADRDATFDTAQYMQDPERLQRRTSAGEREMLERFLDFQRDTLIWKLSGLTREQLVAPRTPSGLSLLGIVKHLGYVERSWFQRRFMGRHVYIAWRGVQPDADFHIADDESPESICAFYRTEIEEARRIVAAADSLDTVAANPERPVTLRWILIHMIEETARHVGHADIFRELTDGQTGE
ncbi:MAG: DinB family protein [Chloroflexota bacterium]